MGGRGSPDRLGSLGGAPRSTKLEFQREKVPWSGTSMAPVTTSQIDARFAEVKELGEACEKGDIARVTSLLQRHPDVLDSPDRDARFPYPESCLWSPLGLAAMSGHEALVKLLLGRGANPVPYEVGAQYHHHTYW